MNTEIISIIKVGDEYRLSYNYTIPGGYVEIEGVGEDLPEALRQMADEIEWAHTATEDNGHKDGSLGDAINILGGGSLGE